MTSPSVDLDGILPYGVTVSGGGSSGKAAFVTSSPRASDDSLSLPGGPVRVSASWSGPEAVRLTLSGVGYPVKIPAGGGSAPGRQLSARRAGTPSIWNPSTGRRSTQRVAEQSRCTLSHNSNRGGGVSGRLNRVCESVAVGHAHRGQHRVFVRENYEDERGHHDTKLSPGATRGREYGHRRLVREITGSGPSWNGWDGSEDGNTRRRIRHTPAGHSSSAGKHLGCLCAPHNVRQRYGGDRPGGRRHRRLPLRPTHPLAAVGVVA